MKYSTGEPVDLSLTAEKQYNTACRFAERFNAGYLVNSDLLKGLSILDLRRFLIDKLTNNPLYLLSNERSQNSIDYAKEHAPAFDQIRHLSPAIVADSAGLCIVEEIRPVESKEALGLATHHFRIVMISTSKGQSNVLGFGIADLLVNQKSAKAENRYDVSPSMVAYGCYIEDKGDFKILPDIRDTRYAVERDVASHGITSVEHLWYTTKPRLTVAVEAVITTKSRKIRPNCVPRAADRAVHIYLDPEEVRTIRSSLGGSHASPISHSRKAHVRHLRHPRFGANVGKAIAVGETVVNAKVGEVIRTPRKIYHIVSIAKDSA